MTIVGDRRVVRRRSRRRCDGGMSYGLDLLAEAALSVDQCGCGRNSADPFLCFLTAKKRKAAFRRLHLSLFLTPQAPKKRRIVFLPPRRPPSPPAAAFPPTVDGEASAPFPSSSFTLIPSSVTPAVTIPEEFALERPPTPSSAGFLCSSTFPAAVSSAARLQHPRFKILPPSIMASPTALPVNFEAAEEFPQILKFRVSAIVGGILGNTFNLAIRKKLTKTDLNFQNLRLSIPENQVANDFLSDEEKMQFDKGEKIKLGVFLDPSMESFSGGQLTKWRMKNSTIYNVIGVWRPVLVKRQWKRLSLEEGDEVELWSFRNASGELCFVMISDDIRISSAASADDDVENKKGIIPVDSGSGTSTLTHEEENPLVDDDSSATGLDLDLKL